MDFYLLLGTHVTKVAKNLNDKYGQKLADFAKKSVTEALKIPDKKQLKKQLSQWRSSRQFYC